MRRLAPGAGILVVLLAAACSSARSQEPMADEDGAEQGTSGQTRSVQAATDEPPPAPPLTAILPALANDGPALEMHVSVERVAQGGALFVRAAPAVAGSATVLGRQTALMPDGDGVSGFIGFGTEDLPGQATLYLTATGPGGDVAQAWRTVLVTKTEWTVDYITLPPPPPPDPDAPPPPPPPPDETNLLPQVYAGVSERKWTDGWLAPLPTPLGVTGYFGEQRSFNGGPVAGHHGGTDLAAEAGTRITATNEGVVVLSGLYLVRGNLIVVDHGGGVFSAYGHMQERAVEAGQRVTKGQVIGYVGSTGLSTGPHLHWEISVGGVLVDGLRWLDGTQGF